MRDRAFGWTVEMHVRAHLLGLRVAQRPVRWHARIGGRSKISGTVRGVIGAGTGILGMVARLWWRERQRSAGRLLPSSALPSGALSATGLPSSVLTSTVLPSTVHAAAAPAHDLTCKE